MALAEACGCRTQFLQTGLGLCIGCRDRLAPEDPTRHTRSLHAISEPAAMLRDTLAFTAADEEVSLREERAFTDQYLALEQLRLGNPLHVIRDLDQEALRCMLPPLTVQPLASAVPVKTTVS